MWTNPWNFKEGFFIGGGLIITGLVLQLCVGPVAWKSFAWPANVIVLVIFLLLLATMFGLRGKIYAFRFIATCHAAIPAMVCAVLLTIIMGLTRQEKDGTWLNDMLTFWPFVLIYVYITVILGQTTLKRLRQLLTSGSHRSIRDVAFLLNHLGFFIVLITATLGNADMQRVKMICAIGKPEWQAQEQSGAVKEMPIAIELKNFIMETHDDGSPKRFASEIQILTKTGKNIETTVDVNKPCEVDGWKIYQYGYDTRMGAQSQISILELVSDPWLSFVYVGVYMMLTGALCMFLFGGVRRS